MVWFCALINLTFYPTDLSFPEFILSVQIYYSSGTCFILILHVFQELINHFGGRKWTKDDKGWPSSNLSPSASQVLKWIFKSYKDILKNKSEIVLEYINILNVLCAIRWNDFLHCLELWILSDEIVLRLISKAEIFFFFFLERYSLLIPHSSSSPRESNNITWTKCNITSH